MLTRSVIMMSWHVVFGYCCIGGHYCWCVRTNYHGRYLIEWKCLQRSVLILGDVRACEDEHRLFIVREGLVPTIWMRLIYDLRCRFFGSHVYQKSRARRIKEVVAFSRIRPQGGWALFIVLIAMMIVVLIDSAWRDDSIGGHIVLLLYFGQFWTSALKFWL